MYNLPKTQEQPQNSRRLIRDMKLVPYWGPTNIRRHSTKFSRRGRPSAPDLCIPDLDIYDFDYFIYLQAQDSVLLGCALRLWTSVPRRCEERRRLHLQGYKVHGP
jgi:hypothetical protein